MSDRSASRPWESEYSVADTTVIAETDTLRVLEVTLAVGDEIPWHTHSHIVDRFFGLAGRTVVELSAPTETVFLRPGDSHAIVAPRPHSVTNPGPETARFLLVQGVGPYDFVRHDSPGA